MNPRKTFQEVYDRVMGYYRNKLKENPSWKPDIYISDVVEKETEEGLEFRTKIIIK